MENIGSSAPKPSPSRVLEPKLTKINSMKELTEERFSVFALGPVYVYGGVKEDLVATFVTERHPNRPSDVLATTAKFDRPVLTQCREWNHILGIMDTTCFQFFKTWMLGLQLVVERRDFFVVRHHLAPVLDPFMLDRQGVAMSVGLDVFCLSGMTYQIVPRSGLTSFEQATEIVDLRFWPPEPGVIALGQAALNVLRQA